MNSISRSLISTSRSAVLFVAALAFGGASLAQPLTPPIVLRVSAVGLTIEGGVFTALEKGYFAAEGVRVELKVGTGSGADTMTQLVSGDLDIGVVNMGSAYVNARSRNLPVVGIIPLYVINAGDKTTGLVIRKDHIDSGRYKTPADLKGMKLAVQAVGNSSHFNILKAAEKAGVKQSDIEIINMPLPDTLVAMGNKALDGTFAVEPFITAAKARKIAELRVPENETSEGLPALLLVASADALTKKREGVVRFLAAVLKGQRDYYESVTKGTNQQAMYETLAKHGLIKDMARLKEISLPLVSRNGTFDEKIVNELQTFLIKEKIISRPVDVDKLLDKSLLNAALDRVGRVAE